MKNIIDKIKKIINEYSIVVVLVICIFTIVLFELTESKPVLLSYTDESLFKIEYTLSSNSHNSIYGFVNNKEADSIIKDNNKNGFLEIKNPFIKDKTTFVDKNNIVTLIKCDNDTIIDAYYSGAIK